MKLRTLIRRMLTIGLVLTGALALAPQAGATVSCNFTTDQVNVQMNAPGDVAKLEIGGGGTILVDSATGPIICGPAGPPTVANTQTVVIADTSDIPSTPAPMDGSTSVQITEPSAFVPGATLAGENGGLGEIEFALNPNAGNDDTLLLAGANPGVDDWAIGAGGINWNAGANDPAPDPEMTSVSALDQLYVFPRGGNDRVSGQGGTGTGAPFLGTLDVGGDTGDDLIEGGDEFDRLSGGLGNDVVRAFGDDDQLYDGAGDDVYDGGAGADFLDYYGLPAGVSVDLSRVGPQDTGAGGIDSIAGIEEVNGTEHADTLVGNPEFNYLYGNQGDDVLDGGPGDDAITGGDGSDTITYAQAPAGVTVDLNASSGAGYGNDGIAEVENVIGSPFVDLLIGNDLANSITGLGGKDAISALAGDDAVDVRDGQGDLASCGAGLDTATADQVGVDSIETDCETVSFAPDSPPDGDPPPSASDSELRFELSAKRKQPIARRESVVVRASCPAEGCTVVKPVIEPLAAGATKRITISLRGKRLRRLKAALEEGKKPKLTVMAKAIDAAGNQATSAVTVRANG